MQLSKLKIFLVLALALFLTQNIIAENPPKREFRGVWFTTVWGNDWPSNPGTSNQSTQKAELLKYIDALEDLNISTICFQVRGMSDAMYQSSTLPDGLQIPWSQYLSGTNNRGVSPGWDPLAYVVQECHNRGIEVYAWINPFRWANGSTEWTTTYDKTIKNKGWLMSNGTTTVLNPGIPEVRQHITYICKDIISRYSIEGIIFDDYFYPNGGTPESSEAPDYTHWINSGTSLSFGDWRRQNVDLTIESIYDMIQETRPEVRLVAGPSPLAGASASKYGLTLWPNGYDNQYSTLYSDPLSWMDKRIVDMMATQIYWHRDHKLAPYNTITDWWYSLAKHFDLHNCVSMNVYDFETTMSNQADLGKTTAHYDEHVANILASREYAAKYGVKSTGVNFYDTRHLVNIKSGYNYQAHGEYLRDNCFQRKSINPEIHWKNTPIYNAVSNLSYSSGKLSWSAAPIPTGAHELTTIRYTVYAIPNSVNYESAITDDGFDGEYFQGISYSPSYTLASGKQSGYWYAVCVFDGFGNEHAPAIYNYTGGTSAKATLISPTNENNAKWDQTFSWSAVNGATYHLQISEFENFSNILIDKPNLTENSVSINLENLVEGKTYYWKVTTQESGKIATESEIFTFNVTSLTDAPSAQLESPSNGATLSNTAIFTWNNADEHVTAYTFQIATDANFTNIINSQDFDKATSGSNSANFYINNLTAGTYYWRVISKGRIYYDTSSETYSFIVPTLPSIDILLSNPENGHEISGYNQHFEWSDIEDATYLFEIAADDKFSHVIVSKELSTNSYDADFENLVYHPSYYWRVTAYKADYKDTSSEIRTLVNNAEFQPMYGLTLETLWNYNINDEESSLPEDINGNCRSMATDKNNIYITRRNSDNTLNLLVFDNKSGKLKQTITLIGSCENHKAYGANGVFVDASGNICVTSIGMSSTTQLTVCTVNISTGETTNIFSYGEPDLRIDYVNYLGDVTKKGSQIWAAASHNDKTATNNNRIYRWTNNGDGTWTTESSVINSFYPTDKQIGGTPWVLPISSSQCVVDGGSNHPSLYDFKAGEFTQCIDSFDSNTSLTPTNLSAVGMGQVTIGNYPLFIYSNETSEGAGYNFNIVHNPSSFDFSKMEKLWTIPKQPLGKTYHGYGLNSIATLKNDDGSATVFVYAPLNGLAAYRISLPEIEISLNSPADGETFEEDFDFTWSGVEGANYTIELSKTESFDEIAFSATTEGTSYNSSNFNFASETQYFWRVKASHPNYTSATSEVRQFTSPVKQSAADNLTITELWNKSVNNDSLPSQFLDKADQYYGPYHRSMTAYNGNIYVTYRESSAKLYLLEFNGKTGAYNRTITLSGDCITGSHGANGIFVDDGNNLYVTSLGTSSSSKASVCSVNLSTGATKNVFSFGAANLRIDYLNGYGDLTKEGGQIWGAVAENTTTTTYNNRVYRWTRKNDGSWTQEYTTITEFYPTNGKLSTAPWVMPISTDEFIVDGAGNYPTLYTFTANGNAILKSGLGENDNTLKPRTIGTGGTHQITLGKYPLFIYSSENYQGAGYNFDVVHNPSDYNFADMEFIATIPNGNLGDIRHSSVLNSIATIKNEDNSATVFVYAPLNGLAAYRISLPNVPITLNSPINNEVPEKGFDFSWDGVSGSEYTLEISKSASFSDIAFSATTTNNSYSSTNFALDGETKYYWRVTAKNENYTTTTSSVGEFATSELPTIKVNLLLPYQTEQTISEFNFTWEALDGETPIESATYKIEISEAESFDKIFYSATTNNKIYSSKNIPLELNSKVYYWRVTASCNGYLTSTSEVRSFKSPTILNPTLYYPYNNLTFDKDFLFIALKSYIKINGEPDYADESILEISKTEDFSEIYFQLSDQDKWIEMEGNNGNICLQYTMPISYLFNGTYYCRVRAIKEGYNEQISAVRKFTVEGQSNSFGSEEENYQVLRESNSDYAPYLYNSSEKLYYTLTNLWIRNSERSPIDRWGSATSTDYRGFCTRHDRNGDQDGKDLIWIARHNGSIGYLEKYDANSGEYLGTVEITGTYEKSTYPCNDVFVDDGGNLCIMNLKGDSNDLEIVIVDTKTGQVQASPRFRASLAGVRIDHANIVGDITSGKAYIFGATSNDVANIYRWEIQDGVIVDDAPIINKIASFYPSKDGSTSVKMLGTAARIYPIDKDYFYVDGAGTSFTLYKFNEEGTNATLTSSFSSYSSNKDINPSSNHGNGGTYFIHDGIPFIVYNNSSFTSNTPEASSINYKYNIAKVSSLTEWGAITKYWGIPNDNIGTVANGGKDFGMLADYLQYDAQTGEPKSNYTSKTSRALSNNDRTNIYIYVPGNGMAAYSLTRYKHIVTGAEDVEAQNINIKITQDEITFGCTVDGAQLYTLSGMLVNSIEDASAISKPFAQGVYVLRITLNGVTSTHKIVIK